MTEETCPGCGSPVATRTGDETIFDCGTGEDAGYFGRDCWANQCAQARDQLAEAEGYLSSLIDDNELEIIRYSSPNCGRDYYFCSICGEESETKVLLEHKESCIYPKIIAFLKRQEIPEPDNEKVNDSSI